MVRDWQDDYECADSKGVVNPRIRLVRKAPRRRLHPDEHPLWKHADSIALYVAIIVGVVVLIDILFG